MLTINLKMATLYKVESMKLINGVKTFEDKFVDFCVVKPVDSNEVLDVLNNKKYNNIEKNLDDLGTIYAPYASYEPLANYTTKKVVSKEDIEKILEKKKLKR